MNGLPSVPSRSAFHPSSDTIISEFSYPVVIINLSPIIFLSLLGKATLLFSLTTASYWPINMFPACTFIINNNLFDLAHFFPLWTTYYHFEPFYTTCQ